jgi:hypothetical protein
MQRFEYKVIPAPKRGEKARGVKTTEDRFAYTLTQLMNQLGAEGWDYVRADALPCDERVGLTGTRTTYQNMLVFRRAIAKAAEEDRPLTRLLLSDPARIDNPGQSAQADDGAIRGNARLGPATRAHPGPLTQA